MIISNKTFDEERALYNLKNSTVSHCVFDGPQDGESALKECRDIIVADSKFLLRYPLWHCVRLQADHCYFGDTCRAGMWYDDGAVFTKCRFDGIKAFRECNNVKLLDCQATSPEFGWKCDTVALLGGKYTSEYFAFMSQNITMKDVDFAGKYSFQYVQNAEIADCVLDTKDAFWHAKNVIVRNCAVKGEYLAWFSENITFINCKIYGTQPLCYCKNLKLIYCEMINCDLSFEYSDVEASVIGRIDSVKNPRSGRIAADEIGDVISENSVMESSCQIVTKKQAS